MSTSSQPNNTNATDRGHNQGRQSREYTSAQAAAVQRVRKCRTTDYYTILDIESTATESEIRKAYRKLALVMHPDKNGAPGADEAFKCTYCFFRAYIAKITNNSSSGFQSISSSFRCRQKANL